MHWSNATFIMINLTEDKCYIDPMSILKKTVYGSAAYLRAKKVAWLKILSIAIGFLRNCNSYA